MGLLQRPQRPLLPHPTFADQRATCGYEAERRAYGRGWRLWIEVSLQNAGILLDHRFIEGSLSSGRLQSCVEDS